MCIFEMNIALIKPIAFRNNTLNVNIGDKICMSYSVTQYEA